MKTIDKYIQEKLVISKEIIDKEKKEQEKIKGKLEKLTKEFCSKYPRPSGWGNGTQLNRIASTAKGIFGKMIIKINVPYHNFNCFGPANVIYNDVNGLMPFTKKPIHEKDATTLFYGDKKISAGSYLPFQADSDAFYIEEGEVKDGIPTFKLKEYYQSFM